MSLVLEIIQLLTILGLIIFTSISSNLLTNHNLISYAQINNSTTSSPVVVLPPSLGIKVASPISDEHVYLGKNNLKIIGTSTDSINSNCRVSVVLNDVKPYQNVLPTGPGGKGDYSIWSFLLTADYNSTVKEGPNKLTAKLSCSNPNGVASDLATSYTVFFRVVSSEAPPTNTTISSSPADRQQLPLVRTSTIPAEKDANTTAISALVSSVNNSRNNDNSTANIATPVPASVDTPLIPQPLSIEITSHNQNQTVPANRPLTVSGVSSDNINSNCTVYADWNDQKPLQQTTPTGPNGVNDYSNWTFTYTGNYHLMTEGANELTSKLDCGTGQVKYYTVNVTGVYGQQPQLVGAMADNNKTTSSNVDASFPRQSTAPPFSSNTDDIEDNNSDDEGSDADDSSNEGVIENIDDIEDNNSDDEGSDADDSSNEGAIEEDIETLFEEEENFFEEDDETESSDGESGNLFG
jgi:hypothetical protein